MLADKTGWSYDTILWRVSWVNIRMMLADAPSMKKVKTQKPMQGDELAKMLGL